MEEEDVLIPPVPSKYTPNKVEVEAETEQELPVFEEREISQRAEASVETSAETKVKSKETTTEYEQLPFDVVHGFIRAMCFFSLIIWIVLIVILSIISQSTLTNTLVGLSPVLLTIIVTYILVDKYHLESGFLMIFPIIFTGILFMLGKANLLDGIKYQTLSSVNILFGLLFEAVITIYYAFLVRQRRVKKEEVKEEVQEEEQEEKIEVREVKEEKKAIIKLDDEESLKTFVSSIEDKAKAINAAIGRVYSVKHGGTESLRKKIKIDSEHYNEINELQKEELDKRKEIAVRLLKKIRNRLELLQEPEIEVFERDEVLDLENIERDHDGKDEIIDVLMRNDKDPVAVYYQGAIDFCEEALKELEAGNEIITQ